MSFLRRNIYPLLLVAVLSFSLVMVARQTVINESGHVRMREDFLLLHAKGHEDAAKHLYQRLAQDVGRLTELSLVEDQQRMDLLAVQANPPLTPASLLFKYRAAVQVELERRSERRVAQALERVRAD